ncbi:acylphosphatase-2-like protein [Cricetulus griseus]|uniref:acylphosphatase n=1 Tax=Cricetulus griseus TaxID=10029 RepID=A0A061INP5_CRIGR|nr:acylphosphatase-2-like protein [Cricetulus griseus]
MGYETRLEPRRARVSPFFQPFILHIFYIAVTTPSTARPSNTILKRYGESGQPCLVPQFRGITLSFSPFSLMLAVGLLDVAFIMFRKAWLSKVGSPSSRIDRTDFSNEKTISKLEYSNFSIRY